MVSIQEQVIVARVRYINKNNQIQKHNFIQNTFKDFISNVNIITKDFPGPQNLQLHLLVRKARSLLVTMEII